MKKFHTLKLIYEEEQRTLGYIIDYQVSSSGELIRIDSKDYESKAFNRRETNKLVSGVSKWKNYKIAIITHQSE